MNVLSNLWQKLNCSKRYRESFPAAVVKRMLPLQIRVLRKQRGWSQAQLAQESKLTQGVISRAEDPDYGNLTVNTLVRIGAGFDCAFVGRFVPFSELAKWYVDTSDEKMLEVPSFADDHAPTSADSIALVTRYLTHSHWLNRIRIEALWKPCVETALFQRPVGSEFFHAEFPPQILRKDPRIALSATPPSPVQSVTTTEGISQGAAATFAEAR